MVSDHALDYFAAQLLDAETENLPLVIATSGRVGSESPIDCELSGLRGVIVEEMVHRHSLTKNINEHIL